MGKDKINELGRNILQIERMNRDMSYRLPGKKVVVSNAKLLVLARAHGKDDIVEMLMKNPPKKSFSSDGCSCWMDEWLGADMYPACFWHDVRYWGGIPGDELSRLKADAALLVDVAEIAGVRMAETMYAGVRLGGTEHVKASFSWGFGRK